MRRWLALAFVALAALHAAGAAAQAPPPYYCEPLHAYYPAVPKCPVPWRAVASPPAAPDQLVTTDGRRIGFDPAAIVAIADHDPDTGAAVTCIYGLSPPWGFIRISESVATFLARLGIVSWFVELTRPDGSPVWINAAAVLLLRKPLPGEYRADAKSVVFAGWLRQAVTQDPTSVKAAVESAGGRVAISAYPNNIR
jgi:hypothetical protein